MRLSTDRDRDEDRALATLSAALEAGATLLDTAPSYAHAEADQHHNERLVARALAQFSGDRSRVVISTKGGLVRRGQAWVADGRAKSLRAACEASLGALNLPIIDLYFLHAPDPKTPLSTSVRALAALKRDGLVRRIGLSNISLAELEQARRETEIDAIQVALGAFHDEPFRSGVAQRALELGIPLLAHSPLGGPKRAPSLARDRELVDLAARYQTSPAAIVLAWLYGLSPLIVPLPGARRPESASQAVAAARIELSADARAVLDRRSPALARAFGRLATTAPSIRRPDAEIVLVMGIQGAGKSEYVRPLVEAGYERLNRDERGGTLRAIASELSRRLAAGGTRFVLDNTYTTRAARSHVLDVAREHGIPTRSIWLDTSLEDAQLNAVRRLLDRYGELPSPDTLRQLSKKDPNAFVPTVQFRARRELEPPTPDEGFTHIERIPFERRPDPGHDRPGLVLAFDVARDPAQTLPMAPDIPALAFAWAPDTHPDALAPELANHHPSTLALAICPHADGPPKCWCRPPLPGLIVPWMLRERIDAARSLFIGVNPTHQRLARLLGFQYQTIS